jgi:hypothetical protein
MGNKSETEFSERETQQRFEKLLRSALTTPPKHLKDTPKKNARTQRKRAAKKR